MYSSRASIRLARCSLKTSSAIILPVISRQRLRSASTAASSTTPTEAEIQSAKTYCTNLLKKYDTPSHTLLAFIPPPSVPFYLALRALNITLSQIPSTVSTPQVGLLRMQYWRDAIDRTFALFPPKEPIALLLSSTLPTLPATTHPILRTWLHRILTARTTHLTSPPHPTLSSLETHAEATSSTLLYLTLASLPLASLTADHLASHIGKAAGLAATLRGLPLLAFPGPSPNSHSSLPAGQSRQGTVPLPLDVLAKHSVSEESVLRLGPAAPGLKDAVFEVATRANDHLITAREMWDNLKRGEEVGHAFEGREDEHGAPGGKQGVERQREEVRRGLGILMGPAVSTALWLERLERGGFDVFEEGLRRREWSLPWRAYWSWKRERL